MQIYTKQAAERITKCREVEFEIREDGVWPKRGIESEGKEFVALEWKPCCELDGPDAPDPLVAPSLPIPFTVHQLAAFFLHGQGWYVRDTFGAWEDGPDINALDAMGLLAAKAREAVLGAFSAYRGAVNIVGPFNNTLAVVAQRLEDTLYRDGISMSTAEQRDQLRIAHEKATEHESAWRKQMVNQLLVVSQVSLVERHSEAPEEVDYSVLAIRSQLVDAFGAFTGMDKTWFKNLNDLPGLKNARRATGTGGRGRSSEPMFCPYEVMQWLLNPKRKKGRPLSQDKGWEILEKNFKKVYYQRSIGDTRTEN